VIIFRHESFPFPVAKLIKEYEEWYGSTVLRFPEELFEDKHWAKHVMANLKDDQKRPFILAVDDGRRMGFSDRELKQSKCSFILFHSGWLDLGQYDWAWRVIKAWPDILEKCESAYNINKQCKLSVSIKGKIFPHNL
jgi:hypothetical protein